MKTTLMGGPTNKTSFLTRGKAHLLNPAGFNDIASLTWCGLNLEDINNSTLEVSECTCQKCLAYKTKPPLRNRSKMAKAIRHNLARNNRIGERKTSDSYRDSKV
jgi:hypothetical protein